jgi:hypothetical protein
MITIPSIRLRQGRNFEFHKDAYKTRGTEFGCICEDLEVLYLSILDKKKVQKLFDFMRKSHGLCFNLLFFKGLEYSCLRNTLDNFLVQRVFLLTTCPLWFHKFY